MTIEEANEKFLNKHVTVKNVKFRSDDDKTCTMGGICQFLGYNEFIPSWGLQITLSRTPLPNINLEDISLTVFPKKILD